MGDLGGLDVANETSQTTSKDSATLVIKSNKEQVQFYQVEPVELAQQNLSQTTPKQSIFFTKLNIY
ncbi:hypothetical protein LYNGBM3L_59680 [Moorena producens 3L]|uniref:Uncharacterized protein n=1 Tax=Moorena producens 3L TaxID=489825 RepID=F4XZX2_9CYAN|nr:hypothetical protein LYNGBM3L_59680 [Moorena producens 3L]OLT66431.1 hypothetical protein BI334_16695 [Moorena producens 3L]